MIEIDQLTDYYRERLKGQESTIFPHRTEIYTSTITYLVAFKQVHKMLKRLADAIEGVNPEGD